jgi:predicted PurR-regulated permease PerM
MSRVVSFVVLVAVLLLIAILFYYVMIPFLLPLFMAVLLVVIFQPLFDWMVAKCGGRVRLAAALTTLSIVLIVLLPIGLIVFQAIAEGAAIYHKAKAAQIAKAPAAEAPAGAAVPPEGFVDLEDVSGKIARFGGYFGLTLSAEKVEIYLRDRAEELLAPLAVNAARISGKLLIGTIITLVALYYFLADGRSMLLQVMALSPLDSRYEEQLVDEFARMSRAVVLATLLSALAQGLLAGVGYFVVGVHTLFLLTLLTMLLAMVPFVGAGSVWISVCLWLFFIADRPWAAVLLALYGALIVSTIDNVIKPIVLHGRSNLHPLLAFLSVLGGLRALGPIGIFVGPMVVAFLYTLLQMFHREVERMSQPSLREPG